MNLKSCIISFVSAGCLVLLALILAVVLLFQNVGFNTSTDSQTNDESTNPGAIQSQGEPVGEPILAIALVSDTENDTDSLQSALDYISENSIPHLIHLGDITSLGVPEDLNRMQQLLESSGINYYAVPGDRDLWKSKGLDGFEASFGSSYGLVEIEGVNFLLIDNTNVYEGIEEAQWDYIRANIDDADFAALHAPIYFSTNILGIARKGMGQYSTEVDDQREVLLDLVRGSNIKAVFSGDQHLFSVSGDIEVERGLQHYVIGALNTERNLYRPNFAILKVYENGAYTVEQVVL